MTIDADEFSALAAAGLEAAEAGEHARARARLAEAAHLADLADEVSPTWRR